MARILLVDDDARFRRTLHLALYAHGYQVGEAEDGREGIHLAAENRPDLVVLDWHLPEMNGIETCRVMRITSDVPIIMISANRSHSKEAAVQAGATDYIAKPFSVGDLLSRIESVLRPPDS